MSQNLPHPTGIYTKLRSDYALYREYH